jgi:hypothetical protein
LAHLSEQIGRPPAHGARRGSHWRNHGVLGI